MVQRWLEANRRAQEAGDWRPMADLYTEDATYGWNIGPHEDFMAVGRDEIRDIALGLEMGGLDGWTYPYQKVLIDPEQGEIIGLWKQIADGSRPDGSPYVVAGLGGSWFRYAGNWQWSWQRDFFDVGNATALFIEMIKAGTLSDGMAAGWSAPRRGGCSPGTTPWDRRPSTSGTDLVERPPRVAVAARRLLRPRQTDRVGHGDRSGGGDGTRQRGEHGARGLGAFLPEAFPRLGSQEIGEVLDLLSGRAPRRGGRAVLPQPPPFDQLGRRRVPGVVVPTRAA